MSHILSEPRRTMNRLHFSPRICAYVTCAPPRARYVFLNDALNAVSSFGAIPGLSSTLPCCIAYIFLPPFI